MFVQNFVSSDVTKILSTFLTIILIKIDTFHIAYIPYHYFGNENELSQRCNTNVSVPDLCIKSLRHFHFTKTMILDACSLGKGGGGRNRVHTPRPPPLHDLPLLDALLSS